jgi:UDP-glucose 4-epimerase
MRVLVIGGAGYIGSHIVRLLHRNGFEVIVYDNLSTGHTALVEGYDLVIGDIGDCQALAKILRGVDAVMHFAAYACVGESIRAPRKYFHNNVESSLVLLNCVIDAGTSVITLKPAIRYQFKTGQRDWPKT